MKIHRFIGDFRPEGSRIVIRDREVVHHIRSVLKLKPGEILILGNGRMDEAQCRIAKVGASSVEADVIKTQRNAAEPRLHVGLYAAILKREHFELVVQKAVEVGVAEIIPVISARTIKTGVNVERLSRIAKEAAEQSGRGIVPLIHEPVSFAESLKMAAGNDVNYFFELGAEPFDKGVLKMKGMNRIGIFVGTEGGWDEKEVALAKTNFFLAVSLGGLTLRAETAAIVAGYLVTCDYV